MSLSIPAPATSENLRGILAMLAAMGSLIVNDAFIKLAAVELPTGEAIFLRGLFTTLLCAGLVAATAGPGALLQTVSRGVPARACAEITATFFYLNALFNMPIADATAILQFTPLAITAGAALFLGAPVGWRRWLATIIGLIGVLIIVRPAGETFNPYSASALAAVVFVAARDLLVRRVSPAVPALVVATASAAAVTVASLGFTAFESWQAPSAHALVMLLGASLALVGGYYWIIVAMRSGDIAVVAPFRYSIILYAVLAGFVVWGEMPDAASWIGVAIVTAAGLYTFVRERRLASRSRSSPHRAANVERTSRSKGRQQNQ
jgi:drug/metabolite transporter (DMT)-like permease